MKQSHLKVGVDVPWVTSWTEEPVLGVRPCASVGGRLALAQAERSGFGRPQYSKNHLLRQRLTVRGMLCPMCGLPTAANDRVTQVARRVAAGTLRVEGRAAGLPRDIEDDLIVVDAGPIAPLHQACSDLSLQHCPHLRSVEVEVMPFPQVWTTLPLLIDATPPEPPGYAVFAIPPPRSPVAVITFLQICGVTDDREPDWRDKSDRPTPLGTARHIANS